MKKLLALRLFVACAAMCGFAAAAFADGTAFEFTKDVRDRGLTPTVTPLTGEYYSSYGPGKVFDGSFASANRCLAKTVPISFTYELPEGYAYSELVLTRYVVHQLTGESGNDFNTGRNMTAWTLSGWDEDSSAWRLIDSRSGVTWRQNKNPAVDITQSFDVAEENQFAASKFKVEITAKNGSTDAWSVGTGEIDFWGKEKPVDAFAVSPIPVQWWSGTPVEPAVVVSNVTAGTELTAGTDYDVTYQDNNFAGYGFAVVTGKGDYDGVTASVRFGICARKGAWRKVFDQVEYIGTVPDDYSDSIVFDTGVTPTFENGVGTKVEMTVMPYRQGATYAFFCARQNSSTAKFCLFNLYDKESRYYRFMFGTSNFDSSDYLAPLNEKISLVADGCRVFRGDGQPIVSCEGKTFTAGGRLYLFASYADTAYSSFDNLFCGRVYSVVITAADGTVLREFVPVRSKGDPTVMGLIDVVERDDPDATVFYRNLGTSPLVCGDVVGGGDNSLLVEGAPDKYGAPEPAYGITNNLVAGQAVVCTNCPFQAVNDSVFRCTGWKLYYADDMGEWGEPVATGTELVTTYVHEAGRTAKLEWQWEHYGFRLVCPLPPETVGSVTKQSPAFVSPEGDEYYATGTELTIQPVAADGASFVRWYGDVPAGHEADQPFTLTLTTEKTLVPYFSAGWTYYHHGWDYKISADTWHFTDGYWDFRVTGASNELTLAEIHARPILGNVPFDLTKPMPDDVAVTALGSSLFSGHPGPLDVTLASSVTTIGDSAFKTAKIARLAGCESVVTIAGHAFDGAAFPAGTDLAFPSLVALGEYGFANVTGLRDFSAPELTELGVTTQTDSDTVGGQKFTRTITDKGAQFASSSVRDAFIPKVVEFKSTMFWGAKSLRTVTASPRLERVGHNCFASSSLEAILPCMFPATLRSVGWSAFYECANLKDQSLVFPKRFNGFDLLNDWSDVGSFAEWVPNVSLAFSRAVLKEIDLSRTALTNLPRRIFFNCKCPTITLPPTLVGLDLLSLSVAGVEPAVTEVRFTGLPPTAVHDSWARNGGTDEATDWKLVVKVPKHLAAAWMADANFTPSNEIADIEQKQNATKVMAMKGFIGAWRNKWAVLWRPPSVDGTMLILR